MSLRDQTERFLEEFIPQIKTYAWSYLELLGKRKEWTPTTPPRTVSSSANVNPLDDVILVSGNTTMTLETAVACDGRQHTFKKTDSGTTMTVACTGSQTIDGVASIAATVQHGSLTVKSNGTNWITVVRNTAGVTAIPSASAYNTNGGDTFAAAAFTKVPMQTEEFDVGGYFDNATNYRYTPLVAGIYAVSWSVNLTGTNVAATNRYISLLYKNGALLKNGSESAPIAAGQYTSNGSALVSMNGSTDYLEIFFYNSNAVTTVTCGGLTASFCSFGWIGPSS